MPLHPLDFGCQSRLHRCRVANGHVPTRCLHRSFAERVAEMGSDPVMPHPSRSKTERGHPRATPRRAIAGVHNSAGVRANSNYFFSAASCWFALLTAALTAARNGSLPAGACTLPDSVLRKETFLP